MSDDLRVFMIMPHVSREAIGEAFSGFKWAEALSSRVNLTVAALEREGHTPVGEQLPLAEVVTWPEPWLFRKQTLFRSMAKPQWPFFAWHVRRLLKRQAKRFDIAHQFLPMAMRYSTPLRGFGLPYVIGPLGGGLETPPGFLAETASARWFTKLRNLDSYRRRYDRGLRNTYADADLVLGVAPYIEQTLRRAQIPLRRYRNVLELGIEELAPLAERPARSGITLLHVGRGVRTKGLRDAVRALAQLRDRPDIRLVSAGAGEEIEICRAEAERLGVADRVTFLGWVPRTQVEELYASADIFVFPSFREPTGSVLYEAMRWGLPIIAARYGGPDWIIDDDCGLKVEVESPEQLTRDVAAAIRRLADDAPLRERLGAGGRAKLASEGMWGRKADWLVEEYRQILPARVRP